MIKHVFAAGILSIAATGALAQSAVNVGDIFAQCQAQPEQCSVLLEQAIAAITAPQSGLDVTAADNLLRQLATVAVSVAQDNPSVGNDLGQVVAEIADEVSSDSNIGDQLADIADQVIDGKADDIDLSAVGGSPA